LTSLNLVIVLLVEMWRIVLWGLHSDAVYSVHVLVPPKRLLWIW
jgi:hypothetical protein